MMLFKSNKLIILALLQLVLLRSSCHSVVAEGQKGSQKKSSRQGTPRKGFTKSKSSQSSPNIQKIGQKTGKISKGVEESNKVRQHSIMDTPTMSPTITRYPTTSPSSMPTATPTTKSPTFQPSQSPSKSPTTGPSSTPSIGPTRTPTNLPSSGPTQSYIETESPTLASTDFNESPSLFPTSDADELPVSSTGSESNTASSAPTAGTRTGCTFTNEDGTVTHFEEGAALGSYGSLTNCINGPPRNYPCYCDSTAPDQRVCPYCQFEDALDRIICAPRYTEVSILQPNQTFVSCQCQVEVTRNSGWYDVQVSSNCPLYNSDSGSGNSVINTEEEKEDTVAPTSTPTTTSTDAPTPAPTTFITDAPTPAPTTFITDAPTFEPTSRATVSPTEMVLTYQPGNLTRYQQGMWLSEGLSVRLLAISGQPVWYENGEESGIPFHYRPDGADIFAETRQWNRGGYIYVSNSEIRDGGVFAITFNANGDVIDYQHLLRSSWNCNGGRTPWGTWLSAEEDFDYHKGQVYQVDPTGEREPAVITMGNTGGVWEGEIVL